MTIYQSKTVLLALLHEPLLTEPQLKQLIAKATTPRAKPPAPRWYVSLWRICWDTVSMVVCGTALGLVFMVIAHCIGLDAGMYSMQIH